MAPGCCSACYKCLQSPDVMEASVRPHSFRQTKRQVGHKVSSSQHKSQWLDRILTETFGPAWENSLQLVAWTEWAEHVEIHWIHFWNFVTSICAHITSAYSEVPRGLCASSYTSLSVLRKPSHWVLVAWPKSTEAVFTVGTLDLICTYLYTILFMVPEGKRFRYSATVLADEGLSLSL